MMAQNRKTLHQRLLDLIERELKSRDIPIKVPLAQAGIDAVTLYRWRRGTKPRRATWDKFLEQLPPELKNQTRDAMRMEPAMTRLGAR